MNAWNNSFPDALVNQLGSVLLHFVWQGAAVALVALTLLYVLRRASANARYLAAFVALFAMAVCPIFSIAILEPVVSTTQGSPAAKSVARPTVRTINVSTSFPQSQTNRPTTDAPRNTAIVNGAQVRDDLPIDQGKVTGAIGTTARWATLQNWFGAGLATFAPMFPTIVTLWGLGVALLSLRFLFTWYCVNKLKQEAVTPAPKAHSDLLLKLSRRMKLRQVLELMISPVVQVPSVVGWLRPVILLPMSALTGLNAEQLEAVLAHELAHVRRHDYLMNLVQSLIETLLFYHPCVWWLSRRIRMERENCCDDVAILVVGNRHVYVETLARIADLGHRVPPLASAANGGELLKRIERILGMRSQRPTLTPSWIAGVILLATTFCLFVAISCSQQTPVPPKANLATEDTSNKKSAAPPIPVFKPDPKLVEIIRNVRENEERFRDLETVVRINRHYAKQGNPQKLSVIEGEELRRTVWQGDLLYFKMNETLTRADEAKFNFERISAFDGERTRSVSTGVSANIHAGRHESPYISPPHSWTLKDLYVNFPLSTFLEGTDAIRKNPKVHWYPSAVTSLFDFTRVHAKHEAEEEIRGLRCDRIRVRRWQHGSGEIGSDYLLWLAKDRNYLCVQVHGFTPNQGGGMDHSLPREFPSNSVVVDELREVVAGLWLPAKITYRRTGITIHPSNEALPDNTTDTLTLESAVAAPAHPPALFRDVAMPDGIPVYEIKDGRLAGPNFAEQSTPAESTQRLKALAGKLQANEEREANLLTVFETTRQNHQLRIQRVDLPFSTLAGLSPSTTSSVSSEIRQGGRWRTEQGDITGKPAAPATPPTRSSSFDGEWTRSIQTLSSPGEKEQKFRISAALKRGSDEETHFATPLIFQDVRRLLPAIFAEIGTAQTSVAPNRVAWIGEDLRDGLRCEVVRVVAGDSEGSPVSTRSYRLIWLAKERNYLPVRSEFYNRSLARTPLPEHVTVADDFKEIGPGMWYPHHIRTVVHAAQNSIAELSVGEMVSTNQTDIVVKKALWNPDVEPDMFAGPSVPKGTRVSVRGTDRFLFSSFEQPETGPLVVSDDKLRELMIGSWNQLNSNRMNQQTGRGAVFELARKPAPSLPANQTNWFNERPLSWSDLRGKVVVLHFWANWCEPSVADVERLVEFRKEQKAEDIMVIGVHTANGERVALENAIRKYAIEYPICLDDPSPNTFGRSDARATTGWGTCFDRYSIFSMPYALVVDRTGLVRSAGSLDDVLAAARQIAAKAL